MRRYELLRHHSSEAYRSDDPLADMAMIRYLVPGGLNRNTQVWRAVRVGCRADRQPFARDDVTANPT
jgi:hypothetical protein